MTTIKVSVGHHNVYCFLCGNHLGEVTHFGGKKKLSWCEYCAGIGHYCLQCFMKKYAKPKKRRSTH